MLMFKNVKKSFSCIKLQNLISTFSKYWRVRSRLSSSWIDLYAVLALQPILNFICIYSAPLWHTGISMRDLFFFFLSGSAVKTLSRDGVGIPGAICPGSSWSLLSETAAKESGLNANAPFSVTHWQQASQVRPWGQTANQNKGIN